jgi:hypothetical protein
MLNFRQYLTSSLVGACSLALLAGPSAEAGTITTSVLETFDDTTTPFTLAFSDEDTLASGTGPSTGVAPGFTIQNGEAVFYNNSNFFDVGTALVDFAGPVPAAFAVSADVNIFQESSFASNFNYTTAETGVLALADANVSNSDTFPSTGVYAYVKETNTGGGSYEFRIAVGGNVVATGSTFDLTDGSPDFNVGLSGIFTTGGDLNVTAVLNDVGGQNTQTLNTTVLAADLPTGDRYGVRLSPGFNGYEVGIDNINVVIPEPASLALVGLGGLLLVPRRRGR